MSPLLQIHGTAAKKTQAHGKRDIRGKDTDVRRERQLKRDADVRRERQLKRDPDAGRQRQLEKRHRSKDRKANLKNIDDSVEILGENTRTPGLRDS